MIDRDKKPPSFYDNPWGSSWTKISAIIVIGTLILYAMAAFFGWLSPNDPIEPIIK